MANIELDGANKKIKVDSGDLTLDVPGDIILDADGADLVFADGGTNILKITNSSSDVVFQPQVDAKDIIFKQYDGTTVATIEDNGTLNVPTGKLAINATAITSTAAELNILDGVTATATELNLIDGVTATTAELNILDGVTSTAAELNIVDGNTSATSTTIADADRVVLNDNGTMVQVAVTDLKTYIGGFDVSSITGATALTTMPASTDELVLSDNGTLKRLDFAHLFATPAFEATRSASYNISDATAEKVDFDTEVFDTDGKYDHSSNNRFTPTVAGKYFCYLSVQQSGEANNNFEQGYAYIYKNGSSHAQVHTSSYSGNALRDITLNVYAVIDLDDDDYIEAYAFYDDNDMGSNPRLVGGNSGTRFGAYRLLI